MGIFIMLNLLKNAPPTIKTIGNAIHNTELSSTGAFDAIKSFFVPSKIITAITHKIGSNKTLKRTTIYFIIIKFLASLSSPVGMK